MKSIKIQNDNLLSIMIAKIIFNTFFLKRVLNILIPTIFLSLLLSCNMAQNTDNRIEATESIITIDSLMDLTRKDCEIIEMKLTKDTLLIVSTNDILYYPYGKYSLFEDFQLSHSIIKENNYKIDSIEKDFIIITLKSKNNLLKFIESKESSKLEIFNADINDNDLKFSNGIKIGMSQKEFLLIFFNKVPKELENLSIIELESGLTGIWHYYTFSENKLRNITMKTDYLIDD